jgi:glycosyltransferase involved in cell wall biosynthesis
MLSPMSLGLLARALLGRRLVVNPHACGPIGDIETLRRGRRVTGRIRLAAAVKMADAFVAISRDIRNELTSLGVDEKRIWEIPNGVDTGHFHPVDGASKRQLRQQIGLPEGWMVIYAGRLAPEKGIDVLIDAWPRVVRQRPDAQLTLVGAGSDLGDLCNRVESLGIERSVHFVGECSDVAPLLQAADAFVLPSKTEGLPVSLLEAMACGLPVVATQVGGSRQVLEDGVTGGLVPPNEPVALADKLLEANRGTSWGARARRQIAAGYSLDLIADRFVAMYENLLRLEPNSIPGAARRTAA